MDEQLDEVKPRLWLQWLIGIFLFSGTAAVVAWQNSRVGVLWDLSYVLENAARMSLGEMAYRDFPFPYAPVTFLVQAAIIKLTGAVFWHHIIYCAVIGGFGSVLTWRILLRLLVTKIPAPRIIAFVLALPSMILGIYCVFPHPFYDSDCTFVILIGILLLLYLDDKNFPARRTFLTGILLVLPLFIKQNTGLFFLGSVATGILLLTAFKLWKGESVRGLLILLSGIATGLVIALSIIELTAGLANYKQWTITFAASRRTPSAAEMFSVYADWNLALWLGLFAAGAVLLWLNRAKYRALTIVSIVLMLASFAWSIVYLFLDSDASERAERFIGVWSFALIVSLFSAILTVKKRSGIRLLLPFVILVTVHGAFLSQQLWGSTYALWSLLIILIAYAIISFYELFEIEAIFPAITASGIIALSLLICGGFYIYSNERLDYINLDDGDLAHSQFPQLAGLTVRGDYLPGFDELVNYTEKEIPKDEGILMLPGEDLFYYTTGRQPRFPVLMFDHTVNPLSSEEIVEQARARDIRWLVVKNDLQIDENPIEDREHLMEMLKQDFKHIDSLDNYEIYRRRMQGETDDDDDDSSDDNNSDDQSDGGDDSDDSSN